MYKVYWEGERGFPVIWHLHCDALEWASLVQEGVDNGLVYMGTRCGVESKKLGSHGGRNPAGNPHARWQGRASFKGVGSKE